MNPVNENSNKNFPRESEIAKNISEIQIHGDTIFSKSTEESPLPITKLKERKCHVIDYLRSNIPFIGILTAFGAELVYEVLSYFSENVAGKFIAVLLQKMGKYPVDNIENSLKQINNIEDNMKKATDCIYSHLEKIAKSDDLKGITKMCGIIHYLANDKDASEDENLKLITYAIPYVIESIVNEGEIDESQKFLIDEFFDNFVEKLEDKELLNGAVTLLTSMIESRDGDLIGKAKKIINDKFIKKVNETVKNPEYPERFDGIVKFLVSMIKSKDIELINSANKVMDDEFTKKFDENLKNYVNTDGKIKEHTSQVGRMIDLLTCMIRSKGVLKDKAVNILKEGPFGMEFFKKYSSNWDNIVICFDVRMLITSLLSDNLLHEDQVLMKKLFGQEIAKNISKYNDVESLVSKWSTDELFENLTFFKKS